MILVLYQSKNKIVRGSIEMEVPILYSNVGEPTSNNIAIALVCSNNNGIATVVGLINMYYSDI